MSDAPGLELPEGTPPWLTAFVREAQRETDTLRENGAEQAAARDILWESFHQADSGWRITNVWPAGLATRGKRQAEQFLGALRKPVAEFDVYARLDK